MRLIDADAFSEVIKKQSALSMTKGIIEQFIKSQPTVYDVDKVVEQLEEYREEVGAVLTDMIDVVKAGGVNE